MDTSAIAKERAIELGKGPQATATIPRLPDLERPRPVAIHRAGHGWWDVATKYYLYGTLGSAAVAAVLKFRNDRSLAGASRTMLDALGNCQDELTRFEGTASFLALMIPTAAVAGIALALQLVVRTRHELS